MAKQFGFGRKERLKSRKQIDLLFKDGKSFTINPLKTIYRFIPADEGIIQVGVSVSKRNFKKAVDRNRIKRLMREAYRLQKVEINSGSTQQKTRGHIFFIYVGKSMVPFQIIKEAMKKSLDKLVKLAAIHEVHS